jgi:hypothetical protein
VAVQVSPQGEVVQVYHVWVCVDDMVEIEE